MNTPDTERTLLDPTQPTHTGNLYGGKVIYKHTPDTGLGVSPAMICNQCDCRFRPIEGNLCQCQCHLCTGGHSTKG